RARLALGRLELLGEPRHLGRGARLEPRAQRLAVLGELVPLAGHAVTRPLAVAQLLAGGGHAALELDDAGPQVVDAVEGALALGVGARRLRLGAPRLPRGLAHRGALALRLRGGGLGALLRGVELGDDRLHHPRGECAVLVALDAEDGPRELAKRIARLHD